MIGQLNMAGLDRVETAIKRLQTFEPPEGYFLAFSGGKDSVVIKALADMAEVKYDAHYSVTSVDPPELVYFIREHHPDVSFDRPLDKDGKQITMWNLIARHNFPPTRIARYCCASLKESAGAGRFVITGVRWAESSNRAAKRSGLEIGSRKKHELLDPDNPEQGLTHLCMAKSNRILNPIIDWSNQDVWEFIHAKKIPYCSLYDEGCKRLGCVGCPCANTRERARQLEQYPKFRVAYIRAFERMLANRDETQDWQTGADVMTWWLK